MENLPRSLSKGSVTTSRLLSSASFNKRKSPYLFRSSSEPYEDDREDEFSAYHSGSPSLVNSAQPYFSKPPRNSSTSTFSDYDDLDHFGGRFESRSTLEPRPRVDSNLTSADGHNRSGSLVNGPPQRVNKKKTKGFLRIWKGMSSSSNHPPLPTSESQQSQGKLPGRLRTLKSIGPLRGGKSRPSPSGISYTVPLKPVGRSPVLPEHDFVNAGFNSDKNCLVSLLINRFYSVNLCGPSQSNLRQLLISLSLPFLPLPVQHSSSSTESN